MTQLLTQTEVLERAAGIRLLVLDVDGVLTDGRLYFTAEGETLKAFHVRDGSGMVQLRKAGIAIAIISGRDSSMVSTRLRELGVTHIQQGSRDKHGGLQHLLNELQLKPEQVACVGDDTPDLPMFEIAHLGCAVADAHPAVLRVAHYVTQASGGLGAVREVCDLILQAQAGQRPTN